MRRSKLNMNRTPLFRYTLPVDEREGASALLLALKRANVGGHPGPASIISMTDASIVSAMVDLVEVLLAPDAGATFILDGDDNLTGPQLVVLRRRSGRKVRPAEQDRVGPRRQGEHGMAYLHRVAEILPELINMSRPRAKKSADFLPAPVLHIHVLSTAAVEKARLLLLALLEARDAGGMALGVGKTSNNIGLTTLAALCDLVSILAREGTAIILPLSKNHMAEASQPRDLYRRTTDPAVILGALQPV